MNQIHIIKLYKLHGTWVFDDPAVGLRHEPFVMGVPEIIEQATATIPNANDGFRLLFSEHPFPGHALVLQHLREEVGGHWYWVNDLGKEGWLWPAMFRYFDIAPETIYVGIEAIAATAAAPAQTIATAPPAPAGGVELGADAWVGPAVVLAAGVALWSLGHWSVRSAATLLGVALGGLAAWALLPAFFETPGPLINAGGIALGALLGLAFGVFVYRWSIALGGAAVVGAAVFWGMLVAAPVLIEPGEAPALRETTRGAEPSGPSDSALGRRAGAGDLASDFVDLPDDLDARRVAQEAAVAARAQAQRVWAAIEPRWDTLDGRGRFASAGAGVVGAALGLAMGMIMTRTTGRLACAAAGSAVLLLGGHALARALGATPPQFTDWAWAIALTLLTVVGWAVQHGLAKRMRKKDKA